MMKLQRNVLLAPKTTFKIGGKAQYFFAAKTKKDILSAFLYAKKLDIPFFVLGGGSNLLVSDKGFKGLVIQILNTKYKILNTNAYVEAGVSFPWLIRETTKRGLAGLEWAGGLPGTVGGAVRGNAGAFGGETKDSVVYVDCIDQQGKVRKLSRKQCQFSYRSSIFKKRNWIVLGAAFKFKKGNAKELQLIAQSHIQYREDRNPLEFPNAGSIFKNCDLKEVPKKFHDFVKPAVKVDPFPVVPTAFLIANAGLKGLRVGKAEVSQKHPNFLINIGNAKAKDVKGLIQKVKHAIKKKFSIDLEEEVQYLE
ncbi:MAG: UDP-N-acetylmuramate dehydrogenase [Candidatus Wildermuthbacteria bacterium]|nr:UDP-N-acetylmuramate dehydrogenase [Candidatus Wildermuthbacteria bacterium]